MRKELYVFMTALLLMTACGKTDSNIGKETSASEIQQTEKEQETEEKKEELAEEPAETVGESNAENRPLNIELSAEYEGEWDEKGAIITADSATIFVLDDGYEELKQELNEYNEKNWEEVYSIYMDNREFAKEDYPNDEKLFISREIEVTRADSKILSFTNKETTYFGGAHSNTYINGEVFDSQTGKKLELMDVVSDYDSICGYVLEALKTEYYEDMFFEGYEETVRELFYPGEDAQTALEWNMDMKGITFTFSPYTIGTWAAGTFTVSLPFEGHEDWIQEEYLVTTERPIFRVKDNMQFKADADGDGEEETYILFTERDEETDLTNLRLCQYTGNEDPETKSLEIAGEKEISVYGNFLYAYVVTAKNGNKYLYAELWSESDFQHFEVFDLAAVSGEGDAYVGDFGAATYGHFISDSDRFVLYSRIYILGTYTAHKTYSVGEDGMPVSEDEMCEIVNEHGDWKVALTTKRSLKVQMHKDGSDETEEVQLAKGTVLSPVRTDENTVMQMQLEDGQICDLNLEKDKSTGVFKIDGVYEDECFEDLPYAG